MFHIKRLPVALLIVVASVAIVPSGANAATTNTFVGGSWTLTLSYRQTAQGLVMAGTFRSARHSYAVTGDHIPAADQGADLLRFYGHPFGPLSSTGLVGVATLANTCTPSCATSLRYRLQEVPNLFSLRNKLPGVGRTAMLLQLKMP
jgi:hypothetical protein